MFWVFVLGLCFCKLVLFLKEQYLKIPFLHLQLIVPLLQERLAAIEEYGDLGQGFHLAERDMGIRGFGNIFGEQQTGDIGNVGIDLFFEMLFESLSKVLSCSLWSFI